MSLTPEPFADEYATHYAPLLDHSERMRAVRRHVERVADTDVTILIRGESGVGKELVAKAIHQASGRRRYPFVKVNCAALPAELLESELFGHEKGAFTGAYRKKPGKFELADQGTILLDEIGEMPFALQAKLLHVVQDHDFARVGGSETIRVDVRVIAATNRALEIAVRAGHFREDLYYRLKVVTLTVPPLRERREEIPILAQSFVSRFNEQYGRNVILDARSIRMLTEYSWPGNVRELENMMKLAVVLQDTTLIDQELAQVAVAEAVVPSGSAAVPSASDAESLKPLTLSQIARRASLEAQRQAISAVLEHVRWNRAEAARILNISYKSLLYKIDQCGLSRKRQQR